MISIPAHPVLQVQCALQEGELVKEADGRIEIINPTQVFNLQLQPPLGVTNPTTPGGFPFLKTELGVGVEQMLKFQVVWWVGKKRI